MSKPAAFIAAITFAAANALAVAASAGDRSVIELFTSQGCSSCPPADRLMGELIEQRDDLIVLSLPVDYWDFLGWKDTLADPANAARQRAYATQRGDARVYTPQVVVNGLDHAVGSARAEIEQKISETVATLAGRHVDVDFTEDGDTINVAVTGPDADAREAIVWLVLFERSREVNIGRGENSGRAVTYFNVVREMTPIGMWHGEAASFELPRSELMRGGSDGCAVLVQVKDNGPILGAEMIDAWQIAVQ